MSLKERVYEVKEEIEEEFEEGLHDEHIEVNNSSYTRPIYLKDYVETSNSTDREIIKDYIKNAKQVSKKIGLGVASCIFCMGPLITIVEAIDYGLNENLGMVMGLLSMFGLIAYGIYNFIKYGNKKKVYNRLLDDVVIDEKLEDYIREQANNYKGSKDAHITAGILSIVFAIAPLIIGTIIGLGDLSMVFLVTVMFGMIAAGTHLIVEASMNSDIFKRLLKNNFYKEMKNNPKTGSIIGKITALFWPCTLAIYLGLSFASSAWYITWIIWPIASGLYGLIIPLVALATRNR